MNFKLFTLIGLALLTVSCSSTKADRIVDSVSWLSNVQKPVRHIGLNHFDKIDVSTEVQVEYSLTQSKPSLTIETVESNLDKVMIKVEEGTLCIKTMLGMMDGPVIVRVKGPSLKSIDLSSGAQLRLMDGMTCSNNLDVDLSSGAQLIWKRTLNVLQHLYVDISSSALFKGEMLKAANMDFDASSASNINVRHAKGQSIDMDVSSKAHIDINHLETKKAEAHSSSAAKISISTGTLRKLTAEASSSSHMKYKGTIGTARLKASSAGKVDCGNASISQIGADATSSGIIYVPATDNLQKSENSGGRVITR